MKYLIIYLVVFLIVYLFYLITVVLQKKRYDKFKKSNQVKYFIFKYKINVDKIDMKKFTNVLGLSNAFIVATSFLATFLVNNFILQLLVGLAFIIPLMLIIYHFIGMLLKKGKLQ